MKWERWNEWWRSGLAFGRGKLPLKIVCGLICQSFCHPQVLERVTARLTQLRLLSHRDLRTLTKYQLILARQQFRSNPPTHIQVNPAWQPNRTLQWATSVLAKTAVIGCNWPGFHPACWCTFQFFTWKPANSHDFICNINLIHLKA